MERLYSLFFILKAKIILTDRNVDKWFDSWWKTIGRILNVMDSFPVSWVFAKNGNPKMKQVCFQFNLILVITVKYVMLFPGKILRRFFFNLGPSSPSQLRTWWLQYEHWSSIFFENSCKAVLSRMGRWGQTMCTST